MLPSDPFSQCIIFSDKIFGIQYLISFTFIIYLGTKWQYHQTRQAKALTAETFRGPVEWLSEKRTSNIWRQSRWVNKYRYFSNLNFTMKGATVKKTISRFSSGRDLICHPKNFNLDKPPFTFFAHTSKIFDKYQMPIFVIEYLGTLPTVRTWLMYVRSKLSKNWTFTFSNISNIQIFRYPQNSPKHPKWPIFGWNWNLTISTKLDSLIPSTSFNKS